ncbi:MAG TPA: transporter suffix domain-containing protein [Candidatus Binatia bacterium]|nr:transporter suffix domain-containing protein [Candidatus Binatia bacterium]
MTAPAARQSPYLFSIGVALIAMSFAIYPAYPLIALLPLPVQARLATAFVASVASWGVFLVGTALAGKQGVEYLKRMFTRRKAPPPI